MNAEHLRSLSTFLIGTTLVAAACFAGYVGVTAWQHGGTLPWTWSVYAITGASVLALGILGACGHRHVRKLLKTPQEIYQQTQFFSAYLIHTSGHGAKILESI